MNDRITLRLGSLAEPLGKAATKSGRSISEEIRHRLSESFGVDAPEMPQGFAAMTEKKANRARRSSAKTRRQRFARRGVGCVFSPPGSAH